ncbi:MAG TPA: pyridoxal-dependent decarboxylase [Geminicoccaceae bacterium]
MTLRGLESAPEDSLDPADWEAFKDLAHRLLDHAIDHLRTVGERPVWQPVPDRVRQALAGALPTEGQGLERTCREMRELMLPYATGNTHPRFWGWVHGSGTAGGVLAELVAAAMNANCGGRDHGPIHLERQVIEWCRELFGFPEGASGIVVSGTSLATLIGLAVARHHLAGVDVRAEGIRAAPAPLVGYASAEAHGSVMRAFELLGLGGNALRRVPVDRDYRIDAAALRRSIAADQAAGARPFLVVGTAGTVNTGAIDDLAALADICAEEKLWLHVDGAFGALIALSARLKPRLAGIERADSLAFDFHKWLHVPYDAGCVLVRRGDLHRAAFAMTPDYLRRGARGLAGGDPWFCDYGPELSRGFRALKVWFTLKEHGTRRLGAAIERNCAQARFLAGRIALDARLELMAPVALNIVCFRFRRAGLCAAGLDRLNAEIVADLQESGVAAPSTTTLGGRTAIRVCLTNHRTRQADLEILLEATIALGERRPSSSADGAGQRRRTAADRARPVAAKRDRSRRLGALTAPVEQILAAGGGSRLEVDPASGLNAYGCAPHPRPEVLAFGSSTASSISAQAYGAAEALHRELIDAARAGRLDAAVDRAIGNIRRGLLEACGAADLAGVEVVLTPSGTDGEYAALHLARTGPHRPIVNIVMAPEETGSGVLAAAQGRHFARMTPSGEAVCPDAPLVGCDPDLIQVPIVPIRGSDGRPRPLVDIDAEVAGLVEQAVATGQRCLVHVLGGSKTGLFAPSLDAVFQLRARCGGQIDVVLDACQMRLSPERVRACLEAGWIILVSGSKFFGGPPFAGALLVPAEIVARARELGPLPAGLAGYFSRPEWPPALRHLAAVLPEPVNLGLLLRWHAALTEMRAFQAVPWRERVQIMAELGVAIRREIERSPRLRPVAVELSGSDWPQTIFPFEVLHRTGDGGERPLDLPAARQVHRWLNADVSSWLPAGTLCSARRLAALPCHLGQPVALGRSAALRVCLGAHLVCQTACDETLGSSMEARLEAQIRKARLAVRKAELIAQHHEALCAAAELAPQARSA